MGDEIARTSFAEADFTRFGERLNAETSLAREWLRGGRFSEAGFSIGFELEAWLLDHNCYPHSINERFLDELANPLVVPELSRFNVEFNCTPQVLGDFALRRAEMEMAELWARSNVVAHGLDANMVMIGILPTIRERDLTLDNISPLKRYHALNHEVLRRRGGRPFRVAIEGRERLETEHTDVMLEAATTSFQVHIKVPARLGHRYHNASVLVSGPVLAACGNAPFLFGRTLWEETRIPLFEQAVALSGAHADISRVTFGRDYFADSLETWLAENLEEYPVLLPIVFEDPRERLRHLRLHNGTIWRWNRPLIGFEEDGSPHLRIEHRILPAGPTFIDMMANAALYLGLVEHVVMNAMDERSPLPFAAARANFYAAARDGLRARLDWPGRPSTPAAALLLDELIPAARAGLANMGVDMTDRVRYLDVIEARVRSGQTGAAWQRACLQARGGDFLELMALYCERQRSGLPVHQWDV